MDSVGCTVLAHSAGMATVDALGEAEDLEVEDVEAFEVVEEAEEVTIATREVVGVVVAVAAEQTSSSTSLDAVLVLELDVTPSCTVESVVAVNCFVLLRELAREVVAALLVDADVVLVAALMPVLELVELEVETRQPRS